MGGTFFGGTGPFGGGGGGGSTPANAGGWKQFGFLDFRTMTAGAYTGATQDIDGVTFVRTGGASTLTLDSNGLRVSNNVPWQIVLNDMPERDADVTDTLDAYREVAIVVESDDAVDPFEAEDMWLGSLTTGAASAANGNGYLRRPDAWIRCDSNDHTAGTMNGEQCTIASPNAKRKVLALRDQLAWSAYDNVAAGSVPVNPEDVTTTASGASRVAGTGGRTTSFFTGADTDVFMFKRDGGSIFNDLHYLTLSVWVR